jgi:hypothetical protein
MHSVETLLRMVCTEAAEGPEYHLCDRNYRPPHYRSDEVNDHLPPIRFDLELVRNPAGSVDWVE